MKKIISVILAISVLFALSACGKNNLQNKKTVIAPEIENIKFSFINASNSATAENKTYTEDKKSKNEDYIDESITEKTITFLGEEFQNIPYTKSRKNPYKDRDEDIFENKDIHVTIKKSGEIRAFSTRTPLNIFPNETQNSVELAKKYLNAIMPDFQYDEVSERNLIGYESIWYNFYKVINGIPTSESVVIGFNLKGEFKFFSSYDVGKYDNIEIKGIDKDIYLKKVDEIIKTTYGDTLKDYRIGDDGPFYEIFSDNKLELLIPIEIETVTYPNGFGETIALELN